jgi:hypothetical protein
VCSALQALVDSKVTVEMGGTSQQLARIVAAGGRFMMMDTETPARKAFLVSHIALAEAYAEATDAVFPFNKSEVGFHGGMLELAVSMALLDKISNASCVQHSTAPTAVRCIRPA